jgi:hypothetical protein
VWKWTEDCEGREWRRDRQFGGGCAGVKYSTMEEHTAARPTTSSLASSVHWARPSEEGEQTGSGSLGPLLQGATGEHGKEQSASSDMDEV